jgi:hypothetical protein
MSERDEEARRRARAQWPVRTFALGEEPGDDLAGETTPEERIRMMWPLAVEAWALAGRPLPDYDRAHIPARLFRPGDFRPDENGA